jgi:hypothetical protein
MNGVLQVERDREGLQIAVRELFEESFFEESMQPLLAKITDEESRAAILMDAPVRSLSPGYYDRCIYLMDLGSAIEAGAQYSADQLRRDDVVGLMAVRAAKAEFEREHPSCPACGTRQDNRFMDKCKSCRTTFRRGD